VDNALLARLVAGGGAALGSVGGEVLGALTTGQELCARELLESSLLSGFAGFLGYHGPGAGEEPETGQVARAVQARGTIVPGLSPAEQASLNRLEQLPAFAGRTFSAAPVKEVDWVDDRGRTYDQIGDPRTSQYWSSQESNFLRRISTHIEKADYAVVDMTGFTKSQIDTVRQYVDSLSEADRAKIVRLGF
jgi:hypothetical protein